MLFSGMWVLQKHHQNIKPSKKREGYEVWCYSTILWGLSRNVTQNAEWKWEIASPNKFQYFKPGYYIKSKMNKRKVKIFAQESSEMWLQTVTGSSLIYHRNPCPMSSWSMKRHLQRVNHFTLRQVSQTAEIPPCGVHAFPPLTEKGTGLAATNPAVTVVKESLLHRFSVVLPFPPFPFSWPPIQRQPHSAEKFPLLFFYYF